LRPPLREIGRREGGTRALSRTPAPRAKATSSAVAGAEPAAAPIAARSAGSGKPDHVFLIDGSGFIFRAYHALPPLNRRDGTPTNAVYGFCNMLLKLLEDTEAEYVAVVFDAGRKTFRNDLYAAYKAHRPEPPEDLIPQFALIRDAVRAFNVACVEAPGFEADDLIATYAKVAAAAGADVTILSSDKDLMQLVGGSVTMQDPIKGNRIGTKEVAERFGVPPEKVIDVQALAGDSVDNVPGVPGIGVKTAAELIRTYGDLDNLLAHASEIKQPKRRESLIAFADQARLSRDLVRLKNDVPLPEPLDAFAKRLPEAGRVNAFLREQEFTKLLARVQGRFGNGTAPAAESAPAPIAATDPKPARQYVSDAHPGPVLASAVAPVDRSAYETVTDEAALARWIEAARDTGRVAFNTETTGLYPMRADLVGFSLAVAPGKACYVPLAHRGSGETGTLDLDGQGSGGLLPGQMSAARAVALIKSLLEDESVLKIGHNIKFDSVTMARHGVRIAPVDDTMVMSYIVDGVLHGHGVDELSALHLGHAAIAFEQVAGSGRNQLTFDRVPIDKAAEYAAENADVTFRLHCVLRPRLLSERMVAVYETMERPLIPVLRDMEFAGVKVDPAVLKGLSVDFGQRLEVLETEIHKLAGEPFNVGSPKQLGEILFERMSLPGGKKGKTGAYATGADVLEDLAGQGHDLPARVLDWRQLAKLKSTYADSLPNEIDPATRRVHTCYSMTVASTGRLSSTDPNLQNIPIRTEEGRKIRSAFVSEKGFKLISADYSQIELRLLAHVAGIDALKESFRNGEDIHARTASEMFGPPPKGQEGDQRRRAKAINFGIIYGISAFGLARQLGIPHAEAAAYIKMYFERYPGIRDYMERTKESCRKLGYVTTLFDRRVFIPGINDKMPARRSFSERAAINAPLQGAAADIIKRAMIRVPPALEAAGLRARLLLQVHDELVLEAPDAETEETARLVKATMEKAALPAAELSVPLVVETGIGTDWASIH
jgi:DNA polymerase I